MKFLARLAAVPAMLAVFMPPTAAWSSSFWPRRSVSMVQPNQQPALLPDQIEARLQQCCPTEYARRVLANDSGKTMMQHKGEQDCDWAWGSASDEWSALVYGEFPLAFFSDVLTRAEQLQAAKSDSLATPLRFVDIGSGFGRLVLGAAWLRPQWESFAGVELLPELHDAAVQALELARQQSDSPSLERCSLLQGDMTSPAAAAVLSEADIVFSYASGFPTLEDGLTIKLLSDSALAAPIKPSTICVTIDGWLNEEHFELLADMQAHSEDTDEKATAFFWEIKA